MAETHKKIAVRKKNVSGSKHRTVKTGIAPKKNGRTYEQETSGEKEPYSREDIEYFRKKETAAEQILYDESFDDPEELEEELEIVKATAGSEKKKRTKSKKKKLTHRQRVLRGVAIAVCVVAVLALVVVAGGWLLISHYYGKTNYIPDDDVTIFDPSQLAEIEGSTEEGDLYVREDETDEYGNVIGSTYKKVNKDDLSQEEWESIQESIANQLEDLNQQQAQLEQIPTASSDHVYNLLLIGVDVRAGQNWNGNSDSMILISINTNTNKIYMTSFMRDLYANIPGVGVDKLNRAHAVGGGPLLLQTIESNFRIHIDNYATVNFYSLINIIDMIGGIDMEISDEEASGAARYIREMCKALGLSPDDYYLHNGGNLHLNGIQAVAYARIRYVGNADFGRTERQRKVLLKIFSYLQNNPGQITTFLNAALPLVTHNIPQETVTTLILNAPSYMGFSIETARVPYDGLYSYAGELLVPDFNQTIQRLQATIYQ